MIKSFFKTKSIDDILRNSYIKVSGVNDKISNSELVDLILELDNNSLILFSKSFPNIKSNYLLRYGNMLNLNLTSRKNTSNIIRDSLKDYYNNIKLNSNTNENLYGYSFSPLVDYDGYIRKIHFDTLFVGAMLFSYSELYTRGIDVNLGYIDSYGVNSYGIKVPVSVPSRTKKHSRYKFNLINIPIKKSRSKNKIISTLKVLVDVDNSSRPLFEQYLGITYNSPNQIIFLPQDVAAYHKIASVFANKNANKKSDLTPYNYSPFLIPSKIAVEDFYDKLNNNIVVSDNLVKKGYRKLNIAERSLLISWLINAKGIDFVFYDPKRDGKILDYNWNSNFTIRKNFHRNN